MPLLLIIKTLLFIALIGIVALVLSTLTNLSRRRAMEENGLKPIFEIMCPGKIGSIGASIPMFRLSIYEMFLVVGFIKPYVIPFDKISRVSASKHIFFSRLTLDTKLGTNYVFYIRNPQDVVKLLNHS